MDITVVSPTGCNIRPHPKASLPEAILFLNDNEIIRGLTAEKRKQVIDYYLDNYDVIELYEDLNLNLKSHVKRCIEENKLLNKENAIGLFYLISENKRIAVSFEDFSKDHLPKDKKQNITNVAKNKLKSN